MMRAHTRLRAFLAAAVMTVPVTAVATQYWIAQAPDIEVLAPDPSQAVRIADDLHRLDRAIREILGTAPGTRRPPTRVFALPKAPLAAILGTNQEGLSTYEVNGTENLVLFGTDGVPRDNPLYGAHFGFTGAVLESDYSFRYPTWYTSGLSEVFAASEIRRDLVVIGGFMQGRVYSLYHNQWIPLRTLFSLHNGDPQLKSDAFMAVYAAECWWVVHQIVIERRHDRSFSSYFSRLDEGVDEPQAFAESFDISYESLDTEMRYAFSKGLVAEARVRVPDDKQILAPRKLSDAEAKGQIALLATRFRRTPSESVSNLVHEALALDDHEPHALAASARLQLRQGDRAAASTTVSRLCTAPGSAFIDRACGDLYADLAHHTSGKATSGTADPTLVEQSRRFYEAALALDDEDIGSWVGLASLRARHASIPYDPNFMARAETVWRVFGIGVFARSLAELYARGQDYDSATRFAHHWRERALSAAERSHADEYLSRLQRLSTSKSLESALAAPVTESSAPEEPAD